MTEHIPSQRPGHDTCVHCGGEIHLANRPLGPTWLHGTSEWCGDPLTTPVTRAVPVGVAVRTT